MISLQDCLSIQSLLISAVQFDGSVCGGTLSQDFGWLWCVVMATRPGCRTAKYIA